MKLIVTSLIFCALLSGVASGFEKDIRPFLEEHCLACHGGEKVKGKVDFSNIQTSEDALANADLWDKVADVLEFEEMPPEDEPQPSADERKTFLAWHGKHFAPPSEALAGPFQPRRLSAPEYRNTLRTLFGFDLEVTITEAEQTVAEKSLVLKLLPPDPPGASGFVNDTHAAPLSTTLWDQYSYLADSAIEELFSESRKPELAKLTESPKPDPGNLTPAEATTLLQNFLPRAFRRPLTQERLADHLAAVDNLSGKALVAATKAELKAALMSPAFLYRGLLMEGEFDTQIPVDQFELAERLSYFLWEDMPDAELTALAADGKLNDPALLASQVDRLLASPKAESLSESFASQWLTLEEINTISNEPTRQHAFRTQATDFIHYLFTDNRPVIELIDSKVTFANYISATFYPKDRSQLPKFVKTKGLERVAAPNHKIRLEHSRERGGILTMPGVLAMNKGPIHRGTWLLRNILGVELGEPPADVPPIKPDPPGQKLSFRERFEAHRDDASCARCHNKIDPLGFALQAYNDEGGYLVPTKEQLKNKNKKGAEISLEDVDTSGRLPTGETFDDFAGLKEIFLTTRRRDIVRNAVARTLAYGLCRELERFDEPTVDTITDKIIETNGTWRDLFVEVATSLPFRETTIASKIES
ncbi:MAG: DUF1592 domain-containing protein [Verrucomicrobiota bacterium]